MADLEATALTAETLIRSDELSNNESKKTLSLGEAVEEGGGAAADDDSNKTADAVETVTADDGVETVTADDGVETVTADDGVETVKAGGGVSPPASSAPSSNPPPPPPPPSIPPPPLDREEEPPTFNPRLQVEEGRLPQELENNQNVTAGEKEEVQKLLRRRPWESAEQWSRRNEFLSVVIRDMLRKAEDGDAGGQDGGAAALGGAVAKKSSSKPTSSSSPLDMPQIEILSSIYYNVKYLRCSYAKELHSKIERYDRVRQMELEEKQQAAANSTTGG